MSTRPLNSPVTCTVLPDECSWTMRLKLRRNSCLISPPVRMRRVSILYSATPPGVISTSPFHTSPSDHFRGSALSLSQPPNSFAEPTMQTSWPYMIFLWMLKATLTFLSILSSFRLRSTSRPKAPLATIVAPPS